MFAAVAHAVPLAGATAETVTILSSAVGLLSAFGVASTVGVQFEIVGELLLESLAAAGEWPEPGAEVVLLGLAARSGSGRANDIEALTAELRQFVDRVRGNASVSKAETAESATDGDRHAETEEPIDFTIDRDDEVGRLSEVIDDLADTVREREDRRARSERYRQDLYRIATDPTLSSESKIHRLLELGCDRLGVDDGIVSRIDDSAEYSEVEAAVGQHADLQGTTVDLSHIHCQEAVTSDDVLAVSDVGATGPDDQCSDFEFDVRSYIGGEILVEGDLYGMLCFVSQRPRDEPFAPDETAFVDLMTHSIGQILERRAHARQIRERERRIERARGFTDDMLDAVDDVVYLLDETGEVRRWNESLCEATGYADDKIESMHALDFFDESDHERVMDAIAEVFETGHARIDVPLVTSDGERIPYQFFGSALETPAGDRVIAGVGRDVSEQQAKERRLERFEQFTNDVVDALDDVFYILDDDGTFQHWNETLVEVSGYTDDEIESMHALDFFDEETRPAIRDSLEEAFETGDTRVEADVQTKSGDRIPYEFMASVLTDPDDTPVEVGIGRDISERKEKERHLREREGHLARTKTMFEQVQRLAKVGAWELDVSEKSSDLRWSDEVRRIHGVSPDEEIDVERAIEFYHPDDRPTVRETVERGLEDGETFDLELRIVTTDGDLRWIRTIGEPLRESGEGEHGPSDDGEIVKLVGAFQDITERKDRERDLERSETIIQTLDELVYTIDADGCFTFLNDAVTSVVGYEPEEMIGEHVSEVMVSDDLETARDLIRELLRADEPSETFEMVLETVNGEAIDVENHMALLPTADGEFTGTAGVIRDVTERKERERRLKSTSARLEALFENSPDMVDVLDTEGTIVDANRRLSDELGYVADELVGTSIWEYDTLFDADEVLAMLEELSVGDRRKFESAYQRRDGSTFPVEIHLICIELENENRFIAISRNITKRKERERDLRETKRRLELALKGTNTGVWEWDLETDAVTWNETYEGLLGLDPGSFGGTWEAFKRRVHPDDLSRVVETVKQAIENDELFQMEFRLRHEDGSWVWVGARGRVVDDGRRMVGINNDISRRKEHELDLERTTELLKQAERLADMGGWELDVSGDARRMTLTDGLRRLFEFGPDEHVDFDRALSLTLSDDQPALMEAVKTALKDGESYEIEHRLRTTQGDERWVKSIGVPLVSDGEGRRLPYSRTASNADEVVGIRGTVQDITAHKEYELALEALHDVARDLLGTDSEREVAELVVETATDILEASGVAVYRLDSDVNRLVPVAYTDGFATLSDGAPSVTVGDADAVLWNAYVSGTGTVVDDPASFDRSRVFGSDVESGVVVPIGDHGVFTVASGTRPITAEARRLIETLVATTEAAFDRLESEASLREREAELEERNRRLNRQIATTELIRRIDQLLIGADNQEEIERTVPERLVEADDIAFAWIGSVDPSGTRLEPRAWAGDGQEYLGDVSLSYDASSEPAVRTARTETPTVVSNVVEGLQDDPWRRDALDRGYQSVISVPLSHAEYSYGVLTVYADDPDAFADLKQTVVMELGEGIANAITEVKTREALHAETLLELTLRIDSSADLLSRVASMSGARVSYDGLGTHTGDETLLFFKTGGVPPEDVRTVLDEIVSVTDYRLLSDANGDCRFEATVVGDTIASRLVRHGGSPRSMHADGNRLEVTVDVPTGTDVREFVEMLREQYGTVELQARRHVERSKGTRSELVASLFDVLTDRQLEVLRTAYFAGFFDWPRESTGEEIADMLEVTQPTVNRHLRVGQQRLLTQLFETEQPTSAD
ncbi:PAS domain S-box protein [Natrinema gelatinilyticum]|uniref:PAS domain S-box protein n=1 Tax=Natrinema gelatinilyticum TaxID=2961571 RepID=UPI0020C3FFEB|nr:PAS domain S-box protein [Natrinema gelatinilyticum]